MILDVVLCVYHVLKIPCIKTEKSVVMANIASG